MTPKEVWENALDFINGEGFGYSDEELAAVDAALDLAAAWAEGEAALPEGWMLALGTTPAAALRQLAAKLRD